MKENEVNKKLYEDCFISTGEYGDLNRWKPSIDESQVCEKTCNANGDYIPATPLGYRDYTESRICGLQSIISNAEYVDLNDIAYDVVKDQEPFMLYDKVRINDRYFVVVGSNDTKYFVADSNNDLYYIEYAQQTKHTYKMYSIVRRQLSDINNGIQTTHGVCEYVRQYWDDPELQQWINTDKTLVVLNGGVTASFNSILDSLIGSNIKYSLFCEEDIDNIITSICVIADERVWDTKTYPPFDKWVEMQEDITRDGLADEYIKFVGGVENAIKKEILNGLRTI